MQSVLNSLQNGRCSPILITPLVHTTTPTISTKNSVPSLQLIFTLFTLFPPHLFIKSFLQSPRTFPSLYLSNFLPPHIYLQQSLQSISKAFSLPPSFSQFRLRQENNDQGILVRTDAILISLFLLKV